MRQSNLARVWLLTVIACFTCWPTVALCQVPALLITEERDYTGNVAATDREWFYKNTDGTNKPAGGGTFNSLELLAGRSFQVPDVVYVRGGTATIRLKLQNISGTSVNGTLTVSDARLRLVHPGSSDTYHNLSVGGSGVSMYFPASGSDEATITVSGLPNTVGQGRLEIKAYVTATDTQYQGEVIWGDSSTRSSWEYMFITDQTPAGLQAVPWTEILAFTCGWADGESGQSQVVGSCTYGLYWGDVFAYNIGTLGTPTVWVDLDSKMRLRDLLNSFFQSGIRKGSCIDVSGFLNVCASALGHQGENKQLIYVVDGSSESSALFLTNLVCPIGSNAIDEDNYYHLGFTMHQQFWIGSSVHDAALGFRVDLSGVDYKEPAIWWNMPNYWQVYALGVARGLVYRIFKTGDQQVSILENGFVVMYHYVPNPIFGPEEVGDPEVHSGLPTGIK